MSWFGSASEWKQGLTSAVLSKIDELENQNEKLKRERIQKQNQIDTLQQALDKQKRKIDEEVKQKQCLQKEMESLGRTCEVLQDKVQRGTNNDCNSSVGGYSMTRSDSFCIGTEKALKKKIEELENENKGLLDRLQESSRNQTCNHSSKDSSWSYFSGSAASATAGEVLPQKSPFKITSKKALETSEDNPFKAPVTPVKRGLEVSEENPFKTPLKYASTTSLPSLLVTQNTDDIVQLEKKLENALKEIEDLKRQKNQLELNIHQLSSQESEVLLLKTEMENAKSNTSSQEHILQQTVEQMTSYRRKAEALEVKVEDLEHKLKSLQTELECKQQNTEATKKRLEEKLKETEREHVAEASRFQTEVGALELQLRDLTTKLSQQETLALSNQNALQGSLDKVTAQLSHTEKEKLLTQAHCGQLESSVNQLQKAEEDFKKTISHLKQENDMIKSQVDTLKVKLNEAETQMKRLQTQLALTEQDSIKCKTELEDALVNHKSLLDKEKESHKLALENAICEKDTMIKKLESSAKNLENEMQTLKDSLFLASSEKEAALQQLKQVEESCEQKLLGVTALEAKLHVMELSLKNNEDQLKEVQRIAKEDIEKTKTFVSEEYQKMLKTQESINQELMKEHDEAKKKYEEELEELRKKILTLEKNLEGQQKEEEKLRGEKLTIELKLWEMEGKADDLTLKISNLEDSLDAAKVKVASKEAEIETRTEKLQEASNTIALLVKTLEEAKFKVSHYDLMKENESRALENVKNMTDVIKSKDTMVQRLEDLNTSLISSQKELLQKRESETIKYKEEIDTLILSNSQIGKRLQENKEQFAILDRVNNTLSQSASDASNDMRRLETSNEELKSQLEKTDAEKETLEASNELVIKELDTVKQEAENWEQRFQETNRILSQEIVLSQEKKKECEEGKSSLEELKLAVKTIEDKRAQLVSRLGELEKENAQLRDQIEEERQLEMNRNNKLRAQEKVIHELKEKLQETEVKLVDLEKGSEELRQEFDSELNEMGEKLRTTQNKVRDQEEKCHRIEKEKLELFNKCEKLVAKLHQEEETNKCLSLDFDCYKEITDLMKREKCDGPEADKKEKEIYEKNDHLEKIIMELKETIAKQTKKILELQKRNSEVQQEVEQHRQKIQEMKIRHSEAEGASQMEIRALQDEVNTKTKEILTMNEKMKNLNSEKKDLAKQFKRVKSQLEELFHVDQDIDMNTSLNVSFMLDSLKDELNQTKLDLKRLKEEKDLSSSWAEELGDKVESLQNDLNQRVAAEKELMKEISSLQERSSKYQDEVKGLKLEYDRLYEERKRLEEEADKLKAENKEIQEKKSQKERDLTDLTQELIYANGHLEARNNDLVKEKEDLTNKMESILCQNSFYETEIQSLTEELQDKKLTLDDLESERQASVTANQGLLKENVELITLNSELKEKLKLKEEEERKLEEEFTLDISSRLNGLEERLSKNVKENEVDVKPGNIPGVTEIKQEQMKGIRHIIVNFRNRILTVEARQDEIENKVMSLKQELAEKHATISQMEEKQTKIDVEIVSLRKSLLEEQDEKKNFQIIIETNTKEKEELEQIIKENKMTNTQIQLRLEESANNNKELQNQFISLKEELEEKHATSSQMEEKQTKIDVEIVSLRKSLLEEQDDKKNFQIMIETNAKEKEELEQIIKENKMTNTQIQLRLEESANNNKELQNQLETNLTENTVAKSECDTMKTKVAELTSTLENLQGEYNSLEAEKKCLSEKCKELGSLTDTVEELRSNFIQLQGEYDARNIIIEQFEREKERFTSEIKELKDSLTKKEKDLINLETKYDSQQKVEKELKNRIEEYQELKIKMKEELSAAITLNRDTANCIQTLENSLKHLECEKRDLMKEKGEVIEENVSLNMLKTELLMKINKFEKDKEEKENYIRNIKEEIERLKQKLISEENVKEKLELALNEMKTENKVLKDISSEMEAKILALESEKLDSHELNKNLISLTNEIDELKKCINTHTEEKASLVLEKKSVTEQLSQNTQEQETLRVELQEKNKKVLDLTAEREIQDIEIERLLKEHKAIEEELKKSKIELEKLGDILKEKEEELAIEKQNLTKKCSEVTELQNKWELTEKKAKDLEKHIFNKDLKLDEFRKNIIEYKENLNTLKARFWLTEKTLSSKEKELERSNQLVDKLKEEKKQLKSKLTQNSLELKQRDLVSNECKIELKHLQEQYNAKLCDYDRQVEVRNELNSTIANLKKVNENLRDKVNEFQIQNKKLQTKLLNKNVSKKSLLAKKSTKESSKTSLASDSSDVVDLSQTQEKDLKFNISSRTVVRRASTLHHSGDRKKKSSRKSLKSILMEHDKVVLKSDNNAYSQFKDIVESAKQQALSKNTPKRLTRGSLSGSRHSEESQKRSLSSSGEHEVKKRKLTDLEGLPHKVLKGLNDIPAGQDSPGIITRPTTPLKKKEKDDDESRGPLKLLDINNGDKRVPSSPKDDQEKGNMEDAPQVAPTETFPGIRRLNVMSRSFVMGQRTSVLRGSRSLTKTTRKDECQNQ